MWIPYRFPCQDMKLFYSPGACSLTPHIIVAEAGLACELVRSSTKTHKLDDGTDFYAVNPLGYVPFLVLDDGQTMHEAAVISQYLADQAPDKALAPAAGTLPRYRMLEWLNFISTELHKAHSPLFNPAMPEEAKAIFRAAISRRYRWLDEELGDRDYLLGEQFTVPDAYLFVVLNWARPCNIDLSPFGRLQAFHARVAGRPAVQKAMREEGLIK